MASQLVLDVQRSSDSMFEGSSMRDTIVSLEGSELVLGSSIIDCDPGRCGCRSPALP